MYIQQALDKLDEAAALIDGIASLTKSPLVRKSCRFAIFAIRTLLEDLEDEKRRIAEARE